MPTICIYCGSSPGVDPTLRESVRALGAELASRGITVVFGGGHVGLMGALADGALAAGGKVIGVIPRSLVQRELAHEGVKEMHVVASMHERKARMERLSDAFLALPGGIGTLDELFEIWTWSQLGIHAKPVGLFNAGGYWDPLLAMLDAMVHSGFLPQAQRDMLLVDSDAMRLVNRLLADL